MGRCAERVIETYCDAYFRRDFDTCIDLFEDDVFSGIHLDRNLVPFAGLGFGKNAVRRRLEILDELFVDDHYRLMRVCPEGQNRAWSRIEFRSYHRATGEEIDGHVLIDWRFRDGRVMRAVHYPDRSLVEAFFRMVSAEALQTE